jgi:hypothetical protein
MNCEEFWDAGPELKDPAPELRSHALACPECARQLADQEALSAGLRAAAAEWKTIGAPERVERALISAFRSKQAIERRPARFPWIPVMTWAAAAGILIALAMMTVRGRQPVVAPQHPVHRNLQMAVVQASVEWLGDDDSLAGEFIPLPNVEQVGDSEDVNVVRMEVPRSAMLAVGLPVSPDRISELVEADVMLDGDGVARAVRFVNE